MHIAGALHSPYDVLTTQFLKIFDLYFLVVVNILMMAIKDDAEISRQLNRGNCLVNSGNFERHKRRKTINFKATLKRYDNWV